MRNFGAKLLMALIAMACVTSIAAGSSVTVDSRDVSQGDTFTIDVTVDPQGKEIYGAQYDLTFDPAILQVVSQTKGGFLSQDGESSVEIVNKFNNTIGKLEYGETRMGADDGVTGVGVLASITFEAVSGGSTDLLLSNVVLSDPSAKEIGGVALNDGTVNVGSSSQPLIDLTPTALNIPDSIYADHDYILHATISNLGSGDASAFNATLKVNGVVVDGERVGGLSGNSDTSVSFSWRPETIGSCMLLVETDSNAEIDESDESNNSLSVIVDVLGEPAPSPSGTLITIPDVVTKGMITVPITIENVSDVGSCHLTLSYDQDVVIVSSVGSSSDLDSLFANMEDAAYGTVGIITYQEESPGLSGDVLVSEVTFMVIGTIGSSTHLNLEVTTLTDATPDCNPIPYSIRNGRFTVHLNGDVNGNGRVDVAGCMILAKHLLGASGFETIIEAAADVNGNGMVEASDCMYLAKHLAGVDGFEVLK